MKQPIVLAFPSICLLSMLMSAGSPAVSPSPGQVFSPGDHLRAIKMGGRERSFLLHVQPSATLNKDLPLVIMLHDGASMAFAVGAGLSERIAAIAPVAGACWLADVKLKRSVPLCYITGTADPLNPIQGGPLKLAIGGSGVGGKDKPPVQDSVLKWVKAVNAPAKPADDRETNGVRTRRYGSGSSGAEVVFITIEGQGHVWPGGKNLLPEFVVGKATDILKAVDVIWEFFQNNSS